MARTNPVSKRVWSNWLIDAALLVSALIATLSGIYFLFLPVGGYMGGRNPTYGVTVLFERHVWEWLHTWLGLAMIAVALIHLAIHWRWVVSMARRMWRAIATREAVLSRKGWINLILNLVVGVSFMLTAISGVYLFFVPGGFGAVDPRILLSRAGWDVLHTWAGIVMIAAAVLHIALHWVWIVKTTRRVVGMPADRSVPATQAA
jgi:hypothetical protein